MLRILSTAPDPGLWDRVLQEDWFWGAVAAMAAVAALVGSLATVTVNAISKHRNRPEPDWSISLHGYGIRDEADAPGEGAGYHFHGTISNVGDGPAHSLKLTPARGASYMPKIAGTGQILPVLRVGELVFFEMSTPLGSWNEPVTLSWVDPPTRLRKGRKYVFRVGEFMERPGYEYTDPETGEVLQRHFEDQGS